MAQAPPVKLPRGAEIDEGQGLVMGPSGLYVPADLVTEQQLDDAIGGVDASDQIQAAIDALVNGAPGALDTLGELADALDDDEDALAALTNTVASKLAKASNLSDLASAATARSNLGLGTAAVVDVPSSGNASSAQAVKGNDGRLSDARAPLFPISNTGAAAATDAFTSKVTGDTQNRFVLNTDGSMEWGTGAAAASVVLSRSGIDRLALSETGGAGTSTGFVYVSATGAVFGRSGSGQFGLILGGDTNVERRGAGLLRVGDGTATGYTESGPGYFQFIKQASDPAAPAANGGRLFLKDNGSAKMALYARFPSGAVQQIAVEP